MKNLLLLITLVVGVIAFALPGQATTLEFSLGTSFPGSVTEPKSDPDGDGPWLNAFFDDKNTAKSVYLTLSANLVDSNKVTNWYFNLNTLFDPTLLSFAVQDTPTAPVANIKTSDSKQKADGDGDYDIEFKFPTSAKKAFDNSDSITYLIESTEDIMASSFDFQSVDGDGEGFWYTAAYIQSLSIADPDRTWIGDADGGGVDHVDSHHAPEPATMLLLGSGLIGIAVSGKKRLKKRNG